MPEHHLTTDRLWLIPADPALASLAHDPHALAAALSDLLAAPRAQEGFPHIQLLRGAEWPPEIFAEHLDEIAAAAADAPPDERGWWIWFIVQHHEAVDFDEDDDAYLIEPLNDPDYPRLIGIALFLGPPLPAADNQSDDNQSDDDQETSISIALVEDATGYGLGTETLAHLTEWAFHPDRDPRRPHRLLADVLTPMDAAKHMLRKAGFSRHSAGPEPGSEIFIIRRPNTDAHPSTP
ncbi:MAG: GNAT family N-acetyltransferase [Phycisphaerales bacterium]